MRTVEEVGEKEAGELEVPRDERRGNEHDDRVRRQIIDEHVAVQIERRRGMHRVVPVGGNGDRRRRYVRLRRQSGISETLRCIGGKRVTYRRSFLLCLLRHHVDVLIVSHHGYRRCMHRRDVFENSVVVCPTASRAVVTDALVVLGRNPPRVLRKIDSGSEWLMGEVGRRPLELP